LKLILKGQPLKRYWRKSGCWRKLLLLRLVNLLKTRIAKKYLNEMMQLHKEDGGFSKRRDEESSVTATTEAIMNLLRSNGDSLTIHKAANFLWSLQKENGSWRENPKLPKDRIPFWSSCEKGVPILTADCLEALIEANYRNDYRIIKAARWLKQMQSSNGMWITLEDADPNDTEPDSTQRAISALIKFGVSADSIIIRNACKALEKFILTEAAKWAETYPSVWPWIAALDGLVAAGYTTENKAVKYALENIARQQLDDGSWPNGYELRVVPTLVGLGVISKEQVVKAIEAIEKGDE